MVDLLHVQELTVAVRELTAELRELPQTMAQHPRRRRRCCPRKPQRRLSAYMRTHHSWQGSSRN